jgi:hypothetical protein
MELFTVSSNRVQRDGLRQRRPQPSHRRGRTGSITPSPGPEREGAVRGEKRTTAGSARRPREGLDLLLGEGSPEDHQLVQFADEWVDASDSVAFARSHAHAGVVDEVNRGCGGGGAFEVAVDVDGKGNAVPGRDYQMPVPVADARRRIDDIGGAPGKELQPDLPGRVGPETPQGSAV